MKKYYCPYCNPKYQFPIEKHGKLLCGLCGEDLIKRPIIQYKQLISLLLVFSISFPIMLSIFSSIFNKGENQKENFAYTIISIKNYWNLLPPAQRITDARILFSN